MNTETVAIIQARMTSTRLPGKVLLDICGKPALQCMLDRVAEAHSIDHVIVATTVNQADDCIEALCRAASIDCYRGDEHDVLGRYVEAYSTYAGASIVRLTADCPMIDPAIIDQVVALFADEEVDYMSNTLRRTYPDGLDVEVFSGRALEEAAGKADHPYLREHVTLYINGKRLDLPHGDFRCGQLEFPGDFSHVRWTLDTLADLDLIRDLVSKLPERYTWLQALSYATRHPRLLGLGDSTG